MKGEVSRRAADHNSVHLTGMGILFSGHLRKVVGFGCFHGPGRAATMSKDRSRLMERKSLVLCFVNWLLYHGNTSK